MLKVTTSWDDGDILDLKLSDMLSRHNIKGTFYPAKEYRKDPLSYDDIRQIAKAHEIGAHTITHPDLKKIPPSQIRDETYNSKQWLEDILGSEVKMFCYPSGNYDSKALSAVKETGFIGARTTKIGSIYHPTDYFQMETTIQVYPFPFRKLSNKKYYWGKIFEPYQQRAGALRALGVSPFSMYSWLSTAKKTFDRSLENGEVFHLWGHSWEIEKYGMWHELEKFLDYIAGRDNCTYITNRDLLR